MSFEPSPIYILFNSQKSESLEVEEKKLGKIVFT